MNDSNISMPIHKQFYIYYLRTEEKSFKQDLKDQISNVCKECLCFSPENQESILELLVDFSKRYRYLSMIKGKKIDTLEPSRFSCPTSADDHYFTYIEKKIKKLDKITSEVFTDPSFNWIEAKDKIKNQTSLDSYQIELIMKNIFKKATEGEERKRQRVSNWMQSIENRDLPIIYTDFNDPMSKYVQYASPNFVGSRCFFGTNNTQVVCVDTEQELTYSWNHKHPDINSSKTKIRFFDNAARKDYLGLIVSNSIFNLIKYHPEQPIQTCMGESIDVPLNETITAACFIPSSNINPSIILAHKNFRILKKEDEKWNETFISVKAQHSIPIINYHDNQVFYGNKDHIGVLDLETNELSKSDGLVHTIFHTLSLGNESIFAAAKDNSFLIDKKNIQLAPIHNFNFSGCINGKITENALTMAFPKKISVYDIRKLDQPVRDFTDFQFMESPIACMDASEDCILFTGEMGTIYKLHKY
jgi:hypothetical protein